VLIVCGLHLVRESHRAVLGWEEPGFVDSGVYSMVRHPMYLGGMLALLGFLFIEFSMIAFAVWVALFAACDWMATYEEKDLVRILGEEYEDYQRRVPKWIPRPRYRPE
jgi:protein-S-isoprenylcysteine O-methyltransferase Ste14